MRPVKGVIFDLDGTLLDTLADIAAAENKALEEFKLPPRTTDSYRWIVGGGADNLAKKLLPEHMHSEQEVKRFVERFRYFYHRNWHDQTKPYEGIIELIAVLQAKQIKMAVLSNKPEEFVLMLVDHFFSDWRDLEEKSVFTHVLGQRQDKPVKPDPASALEIARAWNCIPEEIVLTGDSDIDMITAKNAGMKAAGAEWGFRGRKELQSSGADILLRHPLDLLEYIKRD